MANRTVANLTAVLQMDNTRFKKGISKSQQMLKDFASAAGIAFSVGAIANFGKEALKLASTLEGVEMAFKRISTPGLLDDLQKATKSTVSDLELMRRSVMAHNFKIPLEDLATLFKFATKRAQETGESVDYLVNSIVIGIGRKSPLILDNLGISAVELRNKLNNVGHAGSTVGDVAKAVGEIAREELQAMGDIADTTAIKIGRIAAAWQNFKADVGKGITWMFQAAENDANFLKYYFGSGPDSFLGGLNIDEAQMNKVADLYRKTGFMNPGEFVQNFTPWKDTSNPPIDINNLFGDQSKFPETFKRSFLMGMSMAISELPKEVEQMPFTTEWLMAGRKEEAKSILDKYNTNAINDAADAARRLRNEVEQFLWMDDEETVTDTPWDIAAEKMDEVSKSSMDLGKTVGVMLVSQFDSLGSAIVGAFTGAEDALNNLGQTILKNLGNILIMYGASLGPAGLPFMVLGAALQFGSGILGGLGDRVDSGNVSSYGYASTVKFKIEGRDLVAAMDRNGYYTNANT